jgi:hypothetical protein
MCYGENGTVKFFETLADNVFRHNYSMMQIKKKINDGNIFRETQVYTLKWDCKVSLYKDEKCFTHMLLCQK